MRWICVLQKNEIFDIINKKQAKQSIVTLQFLANELFAALFRKFLLNKKFKKKQKKKKRSQDRQATDSPTKFNFTQTK